MLLVLAGVGLLAPSSSSAVPARPAIAGGYFPAADAWPWTTALIDTGRTAINGDFGRGFCTAVLIAPQRVLTAAHCLVTDGKLRTPTNRIQTLVGRRNQTLVNQGERRNVTAVVVHPKAYLPNTGPHTNHAFYDIAVLFLDRPVTTIPPAPIGTPSDWNNWGTVMGFGHFNYDHDNPQRDEHLRAADYDLLSDAKCAPYFNYGHQGEHYFPSIHVCADNAPGAQVDCVTHGDSGGPLMIRNSAGQWKLIGITSFYPQHWDGGCQAGGPFGFAWVAGAAMRDWPLSVPHPVVSGGGGGGGGTGGGDPVSVNLRVARSELRGYIRELIRDNTNGRVKKRSASCRRTSFRSFNCKLSWRIGRRSFKGIAAIWAYAEDGKAYWTYTFKGKRRIVGCRRCGAKPLQW